MTWWKRSDDWRSPGGEHPSQTDPFLPASRELFEDWLEAQHPRVSRFRDFLTPTQVRTDFTRESFGDLEEYILDKYPPGSDPLAQPRDVDFLDGAVRYIGETLLRHFGGTWDYDTSENFIFRGRPFVLLDVDMATPISPLSQITAMVSRREPLLTRLFDNQIVSKQRHRAPDVEGAPSPGVGSGSSLRVSPPAPSAWVAGIPERLAVWSEAVKDRFEADLSPGSLSAFTELVHTRVPTPEAFDDQINADFVDGAISYLGEAMRKAAGGRWAYGSGERDIERSLYAGIPFLVREHEDKRVAGHPYWGVYEVARGRMGRGPQFVFSKYVGK